MPDYPTGRNRGRGADIGYRPFRAHWPRAYGMDAGWNRTWLQPVHRPPHNSAISSREPQSLKQECHARRTPARRQAVPDRQRSVAGEVSGWTRFNTQAWFGGPDCLTTDSILPARRAPC